MSEGAVYLDASALVKLVVWEAESETLRTYVSGLAEGGAAVVTSRISVVEVTRAVARRMGLVPESVATVFASVAVREVTARIVDQAAELAPASVRSLDAIHLASALELGPELVAFVTYDARLAEAAAAAGLPVVAPKPA